MARNKTSPASPLHTQVEKMLQRIAIS